MREGAIGLVFSPLRSTTDKGVFCKVCYLVSSGGRYCCGNGFFLCFVVLGFFSLAKNGGSTYLNSYSP